MPRLKTKKGVAKRFWRSKKGKLMHSSCGKGHLLSSKKTQRLRRLRRKKTVENEGQKKYLKRMLPY